MSKPTYISCTYITCNRNLPHKILLKPNPYYNEVYYKETTLCLHEAKLSDIKFNIYEQDKFCAQLS